MEQATGIVGSLRAVAALTRHDFKQVSEELYTASKGRWLFEVAYDNSLQSWKAAIYEKDAIRPSLYTFRSSFKPVGDHLTSIGHLSAWAARQPESAWT